MYYRFTFRVGDTIVMGYIRENYVFQYTMHSAASQLVGNIFPFSTTDATLHMNSNQGCSMVEHSSSPVSKKLLKGNYCLQIFQKICSENCSVSWWMRKLNIPWYKPNQKANWISPRIYILPRLIMCKEK